MSTIKIKQIKSRIGAPADQKKSTRCAGTSQDESCG